jgi:hypothetical protein
MCCMKCKEGELRATSLQYSFENTIFTFKIMSIKSELYAKVLLSIGKFLVRKCSIYMHPIHVWCLLKDREMVMT